MQRTLGMMTIGCAMGLMGASLASAQDNSCEEDADCGEGMRCEQGLVLVSCQVPPCPGEGEEAAGRCVDELEGAACETDADCGDGELFCLRMVVAINCPEDNPDCGAEPEPEGEGFCATNETLAASSGLAPEPGTPEGPVASSSDGAAGGSAPPAIAEAGEAPDAEDGGGDSSGGDSSSCSAGGQTGGTSGLFPLLLAVIGLGFRRRVMA